MKQFKPKEKKRLFFFILEGVIFFFDTYDVKIFSNVSYLLSKKKIKVSETIAFFFIFLHYGNVR
ncbi:hypothetical protein [Aeribacillus sp. FSL M8-0235]|uniref:hypothetical protein n=1 Tax=Aeribacillus sp. FSL M8-0235 TaxID=2954576 RepID=UPI0030F7BAF0